MAHEAIPRRIRSQVRDRARDCCEYCGHPATFSCAPFVCEHVLPRALGGGSTAAELAWACPACNGHKYAKTRARDPRTGRTVPLFNPRRQRWSRHFAWRRPPASRGTHRHGPCDSGGIAPQLPSAHKFAPGSSCSRRASAASSVTAICTTRATEQNFPALSATFRTFSRYVARRVARREAVLFSRPGSIV